MGLTNLFTAHSLHYGNPIRWWNPLASSITLPRAIRVHGLSAAMSLRYQTTDIRRRFSSRERENSEVALLYLSLGRISMYNSYNIRESIGSFPTLPTLSALWATQKDA